jgi:site-specific DNA recombinase
MGRLTLNVLLSFAQFEREVTGERIRDKIAASKKESMSMGGPIPIGYDLQDRKLVINESEAKAVRHMFTRYTIFKSVPQLVDELAADGYRTKPRLDKGQRVVGNIPFRAGSLTKLLHNPIYIGKVRHKDAIYDGEHEAIIDQALFDKVQKTFATNRRDNALGKKSENPSLLTGLITDPEIRPMSPTQARKGARLYRYYTTRLEPGEKKNKVWRMPCGEIERIVMNAIAGELTSLPSADGKDAEMLAGLICQHDKLIAGLPSMSIADKRKLLLDLDVNVRVTANTVVIDLLLKDHENRHEFSFEAKLVSRGIERKLAIAPDQGPAQCEVDPILLRLISHAFAARDHLIHNIPQLMVAHYSTRYLNQLVRLSYLAPDIIAAIINGTQPPELTGGQIMRKNNIPLDWASQQIMFGFA